MAKIKGNKKNNKLKGTDGDDTILGKAGNDKLYGKDGNDKLKGDSGNDKLFGDDGNDFLYGGSGKDKLLGGLGDDLLDGGEGDDTLNGGEGDDSMDGGAGRDTFLFETLSSGRDEIHNFEIGVDKIVIDASAYGFEGMTVLEFISNYVSSSGGDSAIDLSGNGDDFPRIILYGVDNGFDLEGSIVLA
jgi:Ca2+-binding RTX toxin-like protein